MNRIRPSFCIAWRGLLPAITLLALLAGCSSKQSTTGSTPTIQPVAPHVVKYATKFTQTESPISEGGRWIGGKTVGLDWGNVSTTPGYAIGKAGPMPYADSVALLIGDWPANQSAEVTVDKRKVWGWPEISIRLRSSLAKHNCDGYEITFSLKECKAAYMLITRWNGPLADYTYLVNTNGAQYAVKTGDVMKATVIGNEIKAYKNGVLMGTAKDNTYIHGNPGFGFNERQNGYYGINSFSVTATDATTF